MTLSATEGSRIFRLTDAQGRISRVASLTLDDVLCTEQLGIAAHVVISPAKK
jgi:hypothetical protein